MTKPTFICVTPVKNEAWILDRFLECASTWADHIVVADQHSDDGSRDIARRYDKVTLVNNDSPRYDEDARQKLLLREARRLPAPGRRIIIALDADEMLTANWMDSPEWSRLQRAPAGTVLRFQWINVTPDLQHHWRPDDDIPFGFVDDGAGHEGQAIHSPRLPVPSGAPSLVMRDIAVLHYQYTNWTRMKSKQRWYQCWERLQHPEKRPITLYRQYHHMDAARAAAEPLQEQWLKGYQDAGIDMTSTLCEGTSLWDEKVSQLLEENGTAPFRKLDVWDVDYGALRRRTGRSVNGALDDPRSPFEKAVHAWLARTQPRAARLGVRATQKLLQLAGW